MSTNADLLQVNSLSVHFKTLLGTVYAVNEISFAVPKRTVLGIVGESGCGKSVTSLAVMNLVAEAGGHTKDGEVWFEGRNLLKLSEREMRRIRGARMAMIFQEPMSALNPSYTVYTQINEVYRLHHAGSRSKREIAALLAKLHIPEPEQVVNKYPFELSGGMRQRIVMAMAIALNPPLLIADEPTTALDVTTQAEILQLLQAIHQETENSIILITHDLGVIAEIAERVMVMYQGKIVEENDVRGFFDSPLHPYTQGLLRSRPEYFDGRFASIRGNVETAYGRISGCPYAPRCPHTTSKCQLQMPPEICYGSHQRVACWLYAERR